MTKLNEPPAPENTSETPNRPKKPAPDLVSAFTKLFKNAQTTVANTTDAPPTAPPSPNSPDEITKPTSSSKETPLPTTSFKFKKDDPILNQIFQSMGITQLQQIQTLLIQVTQHIDSTVAIPHNTQTFVIQIEKHAAPLTIQTTPSPHGNQVKLTCHGALFALLSAHIPELKTYLKKRNISIDTLSILDDAPPTSEQDLKNRI
ncbi:MAG: hypothetical protein ACO3K7_00740 [Candidatus Marinamargulisbacteria bacterium]